MPVIDTGDLEYPPFANANDVGTKLGDVKKAKITTSHRLIETTGRNAINIKIGDVELTLSLNKGNTRKLIEQLGKNSDNWVGKVVTLVRSEANNPQTKKIVPTIRIG